MCEWAEYVDGSTLNRDWLQNHLAMFPFLLDEDAADQPVPWDVWRQAAVEWRKRGVNWSTDAKLAEGVACLITVLSVARACGQIR